MPFLTLDNAWSDLASSYNQNFSNKPSIPSTNYNSFDDGLIRGGLLNAGLSSIRDTARIGKFFASGKGVLFLAKQVGLQLSNPKLEQPSGSNTNFFSNLSNNNTRLYNLGLNTLAQVPINAFGGHIIRHGITPVNGIGFLEGDSKGNINGYNYEKIVLENNDIGNNRLVGYLDTISNSTSGSILLSYNGGAASVYGIGSTSIKTTTLRTDFKPDLKTNNNFSGDNTYTGIKFFSDYYKDITNTGTLNFREDTINLFNQQYELKSKEYFTRGQSFQLFKTPLNKYLSDIADELNKEASQLEKEAKDRQQQTETNYNANANADFLVKNYPIYTISNIQSRIGVGASKYGPNGIKYKPTVDSINAINVVNSQVFYGNSLKPNTDVKKPYALNKGNKEISGYFGRDIIKFRIEFLNNDLPTYIIKDPNNNDKVLDSGLNTDVLAFRAYLDDFSDGMNAKWNPYRYMGRGEEFYVYEGFTRDISVAFTLHAHSEEEMRPMYQKLNYLMSSFTPDYSSSGKMRGNIGYLTVGDYLYRQPGVFTDIKLSGILDASWEIGIKEDGDFNGQYEVPKHIKVALSFKPIHTFLPRKVKYKENEDKTENINEINAPFVTLDKVAYPAQAGERFEYDKEGNVVKDDKENWIRKTKAKNVYLD